MRTDDRIPDRLVAGLALQDADAFMRPEPHHRPTNPLCMRVNAITTMGNQLPNRGRRNSTFLVIWVVEIVGGREFQGQELGWST